MNNSLLAASTAVLCAAASMAQAQDNYLQANLGTGIGGNAHLSADVSTLGSAAGDVNLKPGFFGSIAVGHSLPNGLAIEGEGYYAWNRGDTDSLGFRTTAESFGALANVMYAIVQTGPFVPYVGAGLGVGHANYKALGGSVGDTGLVWQLRAGVGGDVTPTLRWDIGYRYFNEPKFNDSASLTTSTGAVSANAEIKTHLHVMTVGLRQRF
jgi:opacity protein-like surface antigen